VVDDVEEYRQFDDTLQMSDKSEMRHYLQQALEFFIKKGFVKFIRLVSGGPIVGRIEMSRTRVAIGQN
jgi:hypothetical protein